MCKERESKSWSSLWNEKFKVKGLLNYRFVLSEVRYAW